MLEEMRKLEEKVYEWQVKTYNTQLEILEEEEHLARTQLQAHIYRSDGEYKLECRAVSRASL